MYNKKRKKASVKDLQNEIVSVADDKVHEDAQGEIFQVGDYIVYPSHGIGKIVGEEVITLGGVEREFYVASITNDKMLLKIPKNSNRSGMRHLSTIDGIQEAISVLGKKASSVKKLWNKRSTDYSSKINTGKLSEIASVLKDLHRKEGDIASFSERSTYTLAMRRFVEEYSLVLGIPIEQAEVKVRTILDYRDEHDDLLDVN